MNEIWKDVIDYEGIYQVSNQGNVKSLNRIDASGNRRTGIQLKLMYDSDGYHLVKLCKYGIIKTAKVHRIVAGAFISNPKNLETVNHKNEIKDDNRVENLEWLSAKDNSNYGTSQIRSGMGRRKPVKGTSLKTGEVIRFDSAKSTEKAGFTRSNVTSCCTGNLKHHKGYSWEYDVEKKIC